MVAEPADGPAWPRLSPAGGAGAGMARPAAGLPPLRHRAKGGAGGPRASGPLAGSPARRTPRPADPGRCAGRTGSAGRLDPDRPAGRNRARALCHGAAKRGFALRHRLCGDRRGAGAPGRHRRPGNRHLGLGAQRSGLVRYRGLFHHHDRASPGFGGAGHARRADRAGARPHRPVAAALRDPAGPSGRSADRPSRHPARRDVRSLHPDPRPEPDERRHRVDGRQPRRIPADRPGQGRDPSWPPIRDRRGRGGRDRRPAHHDEPSRRPLRPGRDPADHRGGPGDAGPLCATPGRSAAGRRPGRPQWRGQRPAGMGLAGSYRGRGPAARPARRWRPRAYRDG